MWDFLSPSLTDIQEGLVQRKVFANFQVSQKGGISRSGSELASASSKEVGRVWSEFVNRPGILNLSNGILRIGR